MLDKLRIDKYLWCIRLFKTRSQAAEACQKGRVKLHGTAVKPSKLVGIGDRYEVRTPSKKWVISVTDLPVSRVDYQKSLKYYADETPDEPKPVKNESAFVFNTGKRRSKQGRPTKRDKRRLDDFLDNDDHFF